MSRIPMRSGFTIIPEGTYVFRIYDVEQDDDFGKVLVKMVNADGLTHTERFSLKNKDDEWNEGALNAFSYFAKTAMNDFSMEDIDPSEMVDHYIEAEVLHTTVPSRNNPDKTVTFVNLGDKSTAEGFDKEACDRAKNLGKKPKASDLDLDSLLD